MTITCHEDVIQGSEDWASLRCGLLTASEVKLIITPTLKVASNDKERAHVWELAFQRISQYVEPNYIGDDMLRGHVDEVEARILYDKHFAAVTDAGFITNDRFGFVIGCSPDGLVGDDGGVECKSRRGKFQVQTIVECVPEDAVMAEFVMQVQTCLLVTERHWWDVCSYSGGLPMAVVRIYPDPVVQNAIVEAAGAFEQRVEDAIARYRATLASGARLIPTERKIEQEMFQ